MADHNGKTPKSFLYGVSHPRTGGDVWCANFRTVRPPPTCFKLIFCHVGRQHIRHNIKVPSAGTGDVALTVQVGGVTAAQTLFITLQ